MTKCRLKACEHCRPSSRGREKLNDAEIAKWWDRVKDQSAMLNYMIVPFAESFRDGTLRTRVGR